jgi:fibronectin-binding autotransporter adhesin
MNRLFATALTLLAMTASTSLLSATVDWTALPDGDFAVTTNWSVPPAAGDTLLIENGGTAWLNTTYSPTTPGCVDIGVLGVGNALGSGTLAIMSAGSLDTGTSQIAVGSESGCAGTVNVNGGSVTVGTESIYVGCSSSTSTTPAYGFYNQTGGSTTCGTYALGIYGTGASEGTLNMSGGTLTATSGIYSGLGGGGYAKGMVYQTSGTVSGGIAAFGYRVTTYGYYNLSGDGLLKQTTAPSGTANFYVGKYGYGLMEQTGGTVTTVSRFILGGDITTAATQDAYGVYNLSGGTTTACTTGTGSTYYAVVGGLAYGNGVLNISGGTFEVKGGTSYGRLYVGYNTADTACSGVVNLGAVASDEDPDGGGGTLAVNWLEKSNYANVSGTVNFHGGTLKARNANTNFLKLTTNYVYGEGAVVDTNGKDVTIATALGAPGGKGITSITLAADQKGSGYAAPPLVVISGGGGSGATAIAKLGATGNVDRIVMTNPGIGYTDPAAVTLTFYGGDGSGVSGTGATTTLADNVSGGLTKKSLGTLTLSAANTYKGATVIEAGTLKLAATGSIANSSTINVGAESFFDVLAYTTFGLGGTQTLKGNGTVKGNTVTAAAGSHVQPGASIGTLNVTGNLTVGGTLDVEYNSNTGAIDLLAVSGTLDLSVATIQFSNLGTGAGGPAYPAVFATYGTLAGTAVATPGMPAGYWVDYHYNNENKIALVPEPSMIMSLLLAGMGLAVGTRRRGR